ncbi:TonB-dependent receptor [Acidicapsa ligni]|uniref:TonB-dependent receptor n=1 Tax=Acidicapsa ligni TaxID=542300 RepID=UPI0021E0CEC5|nr:TonB-dependent receptor [Acidicapsa ligni]
MSLPVNQSKLVSLFHGRSSLCSRLFCATILLLLSTVAHAGVIRGIVTDTTGATVTGASIVLMQGNKAVSTTVSGADGTYQFVTGKSGRFSVITSAPSFRALETPAFYASQGSNIERSIVLEPQWVHQSIVVTATGTPVPQQQTSVSTTVFTSLDLARRDDLVSVLRLQPGVVMAQTGQRGAQASMFIRGGDSNASKTLTDGVNASEIGGIFDFGSVSPTGIQSTEIYRGPDSSLYGADAASGVVNFNTPRGFDNSPVVSFMGDLGNFNTARNDLQLAGSRNKLDYYGAYSWLQTANSLPMDQYHAGTSVGNFGYQPISSVQLRGTVRYGVTAVGVPNAWDFYGISDDRKQSDQNLYMGGSLDFQMTADFHNKVQYGGTRKREQSMQWYAAGLCEPVDTCDLPFPDAGNFYGNDVTIRGANGAQVVGQAILDYSSGNGSVYPNRLDLVTNRDEIQYEGDFHFTPHLVGLIGFHYENERGTEVEPVYFLNDVVQRNNYDYLAEIHGDFKSRFFYTVGGSLGKYQIIGTQTSPRAGFSYYVLKPRSGFFNGTRLSGNFADAVREPTLADQSGSLYTFLLANGGQQTINQLHISQLAAPTARTWEGGIEQDLLGERMIVHLNVFHNQFGRQIEGVGAGLIPQLLPNLSAAAQQQLEAFLNNSGAFSLDINSQAFRALGVESTVEGGIGRHIFLRGGYTYLDAVVQRSFSSDNEALLGVAQPTYNGIPIGIYSPLTGARPFRRPPHTGYISGSYAGQRWTIASTAAFSSRSDDSTYLGYMDINQGNSLLLPNRNLDYGFAKIDFGGSFQLLSRLGIYGQAENLTSNQHIAPIGYPSLPFNFRVGLRIQVGGSKKTNN